MFFPAARDKAVHLISVCAYGGGPMGEQLSALKKGASAYLSSKRMIMLLSDTVGGSRAWRSGI